MFAFSKTGRRPHEPLCLYYYNRRNSSAAFQAFVVLARDKDLSPQVLDGYLRLYVTSLVSLVNAVLPGMRSRGSGAILVGHGVSAVHGAPFMSGVGPAMAAARNYLYSLHGEVRDEGIYVATIAVAAIIEGSAGQKALLSGDLGVTMPGGNADTDLQS